jgi:hypothetical protein
MIKNFKWLLFASLAFIACDSEEEVAIDANSSDGTPLTSGTMSKHVALGDSYAAGFSDNALFIEGQFLCKILFRNNLHFNRWR